ncbi:hypothetical protein B0T22DRAFT_103422 [Podospora appendiculata]|uniref:Golgi apparatus membrane protein TVP38 n=1 Tax=Podospora appendiculata TaxID=314037 RepID=A0AAE1CIA4_9PEZI|nr:hypothetical protein B0T22DRAFT_103422 [Podospora appendiculata]
MPTADQDFRAAASALAMSPSPSPSPSPRLPSPTPPTADDNPPADDQQQQQSLPPWARHTPTTSSMRRLSTRPPYSLHRSSGSFSQDQQPARSLPARLLRTATSLSFKALQFFQSLTPLQQGLVVLAGAVVLVLSVLGLVYNHRIFAALSPVAAKWRELKGGWVILWVLCFMTAFPPVIGYSTTVTIAGFVFGFPWGWPIVATATVAGSTVAFFTSRGIFSGYVHRLVGTDKRFVALGQVLRRDGLGVLAMIRFCPLPYSLSNGFLATVGSIRPWSFAVATALSTPKLLVHVFIGSRLALLAEDDTMSTGDRVVNYLSMFVGGAVGIGVGLLIYRRTMARAAELAREEGEGDLFESVGGGEDGAGDSEYESAEERRSSAQLMRGMIDPDAAALMNDDDDISLWETEGGGYRDSWDEEAAVERQGKNSAL